MARPHAQLARTDGGLAVRRGALVAALAVATSLGCATLPPCPARGGPAWTQWESAHFIVVTDLDAEDAVQVVRGFEDARAAVLLASWRRAPEPRGRLGVVVFRSDAELHAFLPSNVGGEFVSNGPLRQGYIVKSGAARDDVVTHELVHAVAHHYGLLGKVGWLDEGLARYLEGMRLDDDGTLTYGQVHEDLFRAVTLGRLTSFDNLWRKPSRPEEQWAFSATSWLAVHYLFNHEATRFAEFQRQLVAGTSPRAAWQAAFPDLRAEAMDARLAEYVFREGQFASFVTRLPPTPREATATPLGDAQVHALRALLFATAGDDTTTAKLRGELTEALRLDPLEPLALYIQRAWLHEAQADLEAPRRLIARRPDDALAWIVLLLARVARNEPEEAAEAREQVLRLLGTPDPAVGLDLRPARPD